MVTFSQAGLRHQQVADVGTPRPNVGEGSFEKIENRLTPAPSVRTSARSTQVERALRARFRL